MISCVFLAAGMSKRFNQNKLLADLKDGTVIEYSLKQVQESDVSEIIVVLGWQAVLVEKKLKNSEVIGDKSSSLPPIKHVYAPYYNFGQAHSLKAGLKKVNKKAKGVLFYLADQPFVKVKTINDLIEHFNNSSSEAAYPVYNGKRGNPVVFDKSMFSELYKLSGDEGGRSLLKHAKTSFIETDDSEILFDIDNQEDHNMAIEKL
ncbi:nucleotidyltransferase family protein [Natranaerofaba carboxydovora]|uniref:nucleotidyltransferase family protein n=1 Tax=Natranaerofaba carboxydovora TaxID=2742683 RepID=UPI001F142C2F|nr:nucleotidyltransferase family protein [Natranaerofaba carboxydovora]UMZ73518.1 Purine catabolism protein PucB [Natranaerofaba carboxydovora]